jgi:hypothetical protein
LRFEGSGPGSRDRLCKKGEDRDDQCEAEDVQGGEPAELETEVNAWLTTLSARGTVQRTETAMATKGANPVIVISVWYVEATA